MGEENKGVKDDAHIFGIGSWLDDGTISYEYQGFSFVTVNLR